MQRRIFDPIDAHDGVERATIADVPELGALDVIGRAADFGGHLGDLPIGDVDEFRVGIDEAVDQPGTGDAIDLGMLARHPLVFCCPSFAAGRQVAFLPTRDAAFQIGGLKAAALQGAGDALADFVAVNAVCNHAPAGRQSAPPVGDLLGKTPCAAGDQPVVGLKGFEAAHVDQQRRLRRAKPCIELIG